MFGFPGQAVDSIAFYETELLMNYSEAVILEGDTPLDYADLEVFIAWAFRLGSSAARTRC